MTNDNPESPLVELRGSKTAKALQDGLVNTAGQAGRDVISGAGQTANAALDAVTSGDMENPFLFYMGAAGKTAGAVVGSAVSGAANAAENIAKTALNTSTSLLGDLIPAGPAKGSARDPGGRGNP